MSPPKPEFEVERIVSDKCLVGKQFFFIKWKGFDSSYNTWEPEENLAKCPQLVREYFSGKGVRNTKLHNASSTLMRSIKAIKNRRSSTLAVASPKRSVRPTSAKANVNVSVVASKGDLNLESQTSAVIDCVLKCNPTAKIDDLPSTSDASQDCNFSSITESTPKNDSVVKSNQLNRSRQQRHQKGCSTMVVASPRESFDLKPVTDNNSTNSKNETLNMVNLPVNLSVTWMVPKIELVKVDDSVVTKGVHQPFNELTAKADKLLHLGLGLTKNSPRATPPQSVDLTDVANSGLTKEQLNATRCLTRRSVKLTNLRKDEINDAPTVDLTVSENDSKEWLESSVNEHSSTQMLSDDDPSWRHSTTVGNKPSNKLTVRLFDRTPRPEVLTSMLFLENFDSDSESPAQWVTEDSDKKITTRNYRRPAKRKPKRSRQSVKRLKTNECPKNDQTSEEVLSAADNLQRSDLPKTDKAMVLLTEQNKTGGRNLVMYFPRLMLIKSLSEKMADKFYSQAVIEYYRRMMQPQVRVVRRSI